MSRIRIDASKCIGCCCCELACSIQHTRTVHPLRSRIRVFQEGIRFFPVIAGSYTEAGCNSTHVVVLDGQEYDGCLFCRSSCPVKPIFKEPDTAIPLKCDFCGEPPNPQCAMACINGALTFVNEEDVNGVSWTAE